MHSAFTVFNYSPLMHAWWIEWLIDWFHSNLLSTYYKPDSAWNGISRMTSDKFPTRKESLFWIPSIFYMKPSSELIWGNFLPIFSFHDLSLGGDFYCFCSKRALAAVVQTVLLSHSANAFLKISWHGYKIHWRIPHDFILVFCSFVFFFSGEQGVWSGVYHKTFRVASEDGDTLALLRTHDHTTTLWWCCTEAMPWRWPSHPNSLDFWWNPCIGMRSFMDEFQRTKEPM